ncbi:MAG: acyltransferase [Aquabacterium sp.]|uniref:acyltransferase family protein n=1 Tax=Aquabacterium sp. TaxID=1872578 RepID=UPI003BB20B1C
MIFIDGIDFGRFGVVLFFLLSGFVIPYSLKPGTTIKQFAIRRFFRLYPIFWIAVASASTANVVFLGKKYEASQLIANLTMAPQLLGQNPISNVYWTLLIELAFYVACAILFAWGTLGKTRVLITASAITAGLTFFPILINELTGSKVPVQFNSHHLSFLFAGAAIRTEYESKSWRLSIPYLLILTMTVPTVAGLLPAAKTPFSTFGTWGLFVAYAAAAFVFLLALRHQFGSNRFFEVLGNSSYSLYLLHWPVFIVVFSFFENSASTIPFEVGACLAAAFFVSWLAYKYIELPSIELGKKFSRSTQRDRQSLQNPVRP